MGAIFITSLGAEAGRGGRTRIVGSSSTAATGPSCSDMGCMVWTVGISSLAEAVAG
jgi:hypothetical protein